VANNAIGLEVRNPNTRATMSGGSVTTTGVGSYGAYAWTGGAISLTDAAVSTAGADAYGLNALNGGAIAMTGGSIATTGLGGLGAFVNDAGSTVTLTGVVIRTAGDDAHGLNAMNGGAVTMTGGSVATTGAHSAGAFALNGGAISLTDTAVSTAGDYSHGLVASGTGSTVTMSGGAVATSGAGSFGAYALNGGAVSLANAAVNTSGSVRPGLEAQGAGSTVTMTGGAVTTTGNNGYGAYVWDGGAISLTNAAITASGAGSYALYANGGTITATINGQDISGAAGLLYADNGGAINLTAGGGSRLSGITTLGGGGAANLTLNGGATWTMPGNSSLTTLSLSGGTVAFTTPAAGGPYKTLTIDGNLGGSGGAFRLNTNLNAGLADLVSVGGTASGSHQVLVTNLGGSPADIYRAVKVVDLVNEGAAHTATFGGGGDVGAYRYGVAQGSALTGYSGVGRPADYYLYNTFGPSTPANAAIGTAASTKVVWYGEMNEIKKRLGELRMGAASGGDLWARTYANKYTVKPGGGQKFDQTLYGLEFGKDKMKAVANGKRYLGWVAGTGRADRDFALGGSGKTDSHYLGGYASWIKDGGSYFDLVAKYNWFRHSFDAPLLGGGSDSGSYRNKGLGLSAEIGRRIERGNGVFVQPEAELAALWAGRASYATANGLAVEVPATNSLQLRLGVTVGRKWQAGDGASRQVYGKAAWVNEFRGDSTVRVDGVGFESSLKGHQWVAGLGFVEDAGSRQLYIDVEKSWGNTVSRAWGVNAGYRWKF
jgi:outer membrane autotransporter protein